MLTPAVSAAEAAQRADVDFQELLDGADWLLDGSELAGVREAALAGDFALTHAWLPGAVVQSEDSAPLSGEGAESPASESSLVPGGTAALAPLAARPVQAKKAAPQLRLSRCLEPGHSQPCARCYPAPLEGEEHDYELVSTYPAPLSYLRLLTPPQASPGRRTGRNGCAASSRAPWSGTAPPLAPSWRPRSTVAPPRQAPTLRACARWPALCAASTA